MKSKYPSTTVVKEAKWLATFRSSTFKDTYRKWVMVILLIILALATFS
jgi:hypothetical protein